MQKKLFEKLPALVASVAMAGGFGFHRSRRGGAKLRDRRRQYQG